MRAAFFAVPALLLAACTTEAAPAQSEPTSASASASACDVTQAEREAARTLEWHAFDQTGGAPGSFRDLSDKGCEREALAAYDDWLAHGPGFPDTRARGIGNFHRGQMHAFLGEEELALALFKQARRPEGPSDPSAAVWNAYLVGVIGFFEGSLEKLDQAIATLHASDGAFAKRQVGVLTELKNCMGRPYAEAMSPSCRSAGS